MTEQFFPGNAYGPSPMRIILLSTGLGMGGAEQQIVGLAKQFLIEGHAVAIVSLTADQEVELPSEATIVNLGMRKTALSFAAAFCRLRRFVRDWQPDVIHAHMVHANLFARLLAAVGGVPPVICSAHSAREGGSLRMLAYRLTDRWSDMTTQVSQAGKQAMVTAGAVPPSRIRVMPNGIDTQKFWLDRDCRDKVRRTLEIGPDTRLLITVGRLVEEKAQDVLIDAFANTLQSVRPLDAKLLIVGEGPARPRLQAQIDKLGLGASVTLLGLRHDVPALLNAADAFALSSNVEGMPLVIGEALATGCPIVATDAAGVQELLGTFGTIVKRGDTVALAAALARTLANARGSREDESARRQWIVERFSLTAITGQWIACYRQLITSHHHNSIVETA